MLLPLFFKNMILSKIKLFIYSAAAIAVLSGGLYISSIISQNKSMKSQIADFRQNITSYEDRLSSSASEKAILRLSAASLANSNDSILKELESVRKRLKISLEKPGSVASNIDESINTKDTVYMQLPVECEFDTVIKPNELTEFSIKYKNNSLIHTSEINNNQKLYVYSSREYVNEYKNKWNRFWHFDWKKKDVTRYQIHNTNDLVKTSNTVVTVINE